MILALTAISVRTGNEVSVKRNYFRFRGLSTRKYNLQDASYDLTNEFSRWLTAGDDGVAVKIDLRRIKQSSVERKLKGLRSDRVSELKVHTNQDIYTSRMRRELSDIDAMIRMSSEGTGMFDVNLTVGLSSSHPAEVAKKSIRFERSMELLGLRFIPVQNYNRNNLSPRLLSTRVREKYLMDSGSIASFLPVFLPTSGNNLGVYLGTESSTGVPFFIEPFENPSYNFNVIGETGSGKSFFSKIFAMRSLQEGLIDWLIVIDPLNEYEKAFHDCCTVDLSSGEYLDVSNLTGLEEQKNEMIRFICDLAQLDDEQSAVIRATSEEIDSYDNETALIDLLLEKLNEPTLVGRLRDLRARYFRKRKSLDTSKQKIVIIRTPADLGSERGRLLLMATVTARTMCSSLPGKKMVLVDEMHLFMSERRTSQYVSNFFRNSRHYETSIVGMTQNMYDLEASEFAETIRDNSIALIVFRTKSIDTGNHFIDLADFENPSPELLVGGKKYDYSECLILYRQRLKKIRINATEEEISIIDQPVS